MTSSRAVVWAAIDAESRPVPWVPVDVAPETVCSMMSPMLVSDSPCAASVSLRCLSGVPAATVTVPASRSTARTPVSRSGRISSPSVAAAGVNEWPVPAALTVSPSAAAARTAAATSSVLAGVTLRAGRAVTLPAQLRHGPMVGPRPPERPTALLTAMVTSPPSARAGRVRPP